MVNGKNWPSVPLAISMGCPVGIGPEIICRWFADRPDGPPPVVIGDRDWLARVAAGLGLDLKVRSWNPAVSPSPGTIPVLETGAKLDPATLEWGHPTAGTGRAMVEYLRAAVHCIRVGTLSGLVTCPIAKIALREAGFPWPGHTEMLAEWTGAGRFRMMMSGDRLRVVLVTIHESLARVPGLLAIDNILDCLRMTGDALARDFGLDRPRIGVAGLNPHAGESGMFGDEEKRLIGPAIERYDGPGTASGPWPPDTVFYRAVQGGFDAVVAMYHDQGLIPFKLIHFRDGVNVTLGLDLVRTSVDHGTGYDIAGQGVADPASLAAAIDTAAQIVHNRQRRR